MYFAYDCMLSSLLEIAPRKNGAPEERNVYRITVLIIQAP
jgi:hypothetical protein